MEKLRKALEKAKQERLDDQEATTEQGITTVPDAPESKEVSALGAIEDRIESFVPVYKQSRSHQLSQEALAANHCLNIFSDPVNIESYKMLRTQVIQRTQPHGWNTFMITSALPGEGKTLTAINLALTFAKEHNSTVLLVDCDLRKQSVHKVLGIESKLGLIDALSDNRPLQDLIVWPGIDRLTLISGERTISESSEILNSMKMRALVNDIKSRYHDRYVFFDLPPILSAADAVAFAPLVDAVLIVVQAEKTLIQDVKRAVNLIPKEKFLGFVLNGAKAPAKSQYASHYYAKAS